MVGEPFSILRSKESIPPNVQDLAVIDLSSMVDLDPTYDATMFASSTWTVVNVCSDGEDWATSRSIAIAIIPTKALTPTVQDELNAGDFANTLDCTGRPFHG